MSQLIEHDSVKAARILDSARELVLEHGIRKVTISEIAQAAGVGKGTVYLYWATKEDLVLGLFGRELLAWIEKINARIGEDAHIILPGRLAPLLVRTRLDSPWLRRVHDSDSDVLRLLSHHTDSRKRFADASPSAMCRAVMPILRNHGLVREDRPLAMQEYAVHALLVGFSIVMGEPAAAGPLVVDNPEDVLADTVRLLLEPARAPAEHAITAAAKEVRDQFSAIHDGVLELVATGSS